ncbi:MAG: hypothetical protein WCT52_01060 [Candidatus Micrarchaeia archaeon]
MQMKAAGHKEEKHLFRVPSCAVSRRNSVGAIALAAMLAFGSQSAASAMENGSPQSQKSSVRVQDNEQNPESPLKDAVPHHSAADSAAWQEIGVEIGRKVGVDIKESEFAEFASRMSLLVGNRGCYTYHFFIVTESDYQHMNPRERFGLKLKTRENMLGWFGTKDDEQILVHILDEMDKLSAFQGRNFGAWWRTNVSFNEQDRKFLDDDAKELAIKAKQHDERMQEIDSGRKRREFQEKADKFGKTFHLDDVFGWLQGVGVPQTWASAITLLGLLGTIVAIPLLTWKSIHFIVRKVGDSMRKSKAEKLKAELKKAAELAKKGVIDIDEVLPAFEKAEKKMVDFRQEILKKFGEKEGWAKIEAMDVGHYTEPMQKITMMEEDAYFLGMCTVLLVNIREKLRKVKSLEEAFECTRLKNKIFSLAEERGKKCGNPHLSIPLKAYHMGLDSAWSDAMTNIGKPGFMCWKHYRG